MKTVLIAGLYHETHSFIQAPTTMDDLKVTEWVIGTDLIDRHRGARSTLGGALAIALQAHWQLVPSISIGAQPSGLVDQEVVDTFLDTLTADISDHAEKLDGIFLHLHGAMVSRNMPDVEGSLLAAVQQALQKAKHFIPVCGVLDLHCNFSDTMAKHATCLYGYRKNPHTDAYDAAQQAAQLLEHLMKTGLQPTTLHLKPGLLFSPTGTGTDKDPLASIFKCISKIEAQDEQLLCLNAFGGYAYSDIPQVGFSLTAITGDVHKAQVYLDELATLASSLKEEGHPQDQVLETILDQLPKEGQGPILLVEPSDNIGGGTPGDGTGTLGPLFERGFKRVVGIINDPASVKQCQQAGVGTELSLRIGGKTDDFHGQPVRLDIEVLNLSDGYFEFENGQAHSVAVHGGKVNMGPCATVVTPGGGRILLTSTKTPPHDLAQLRSQGIEPSDAYLIVIKAGVSHKQAYDPIAKETFYVDTPGLCTSNLCSLPLRDPLIL